MDNSKSPNHPLLVEDLTERELDVLRLLAKNLSNREIAQELYLEINTVRWYTRQIYGKLGIHQPGQKRRQAVARAQALGIIEGPPTSSFRPRHNLPAQTTPFIGREQERADLDALLADPEVRLVTILAPGGMGKTRLGLAAAETHLNRFADGVYMVPLAPLREPDQIVTAIAEATHFPFMPDERSPKQQVLDSLRRKHMLLLLDNFEHLLDGAGVIIEMLHVAPDVQIVVTSRERLNLRGEKVYTIGGMVFPDWETPEDPLDHDAVRLFMQGAELACPGFEVHPDNLRYLARICRLVEGMPLGIVLAAAWTEVLSLEEIADEIQHSFDFLAAEMRDVPRRQWSIRAVFEPTWERLNDQERDAFMRFSVFRGGCLRDAAQAVTGADLRTLQALINKALLDRDPAGRYQMHELLRQYAEQQLESAGETDATRDAHCTYYAEFMYMREHDLKGSDRQLVALDEIDTDFENVRAAWTWAIEQRRVDDLRRMAWVLLWFMGIRDRVAEGHNLFRDALKIDDDRLLHGWIMTGYAYFYHGGDWRHEAEPWMLRSIAIARDTDNHPLLAFSLRMRAGELARLYGDFEQADPLADECLQIYQALDDPWGIAHALHIKGYIADCKLDLQSALAFYEDTLAIAQRIDDFKRAASVLNNLAVIHGSFGEYRQAQHYYEESLAISRKLNSPVGIANVLYNLSDLVGERGDYTLSLQWNAEVLAIVTEFGLPESRYTYTRGNRAYYLALTGRFDEADECLSELEQVMQSVEEHARQFWFLQCQSMVAYVRSDFPTALRLAHTSLEFAQLNQYAHGESESWLQIGLCEIKLGHVDAARNHLLQCLPRLKVKYEVPSAIYGLAEVAAAQEQTERAVELAALVHHHRITIYRFKVYAGDLLAELEAKLPPNVYAAAVERGKALDLDAVVAELLEESAE